MKKHTHLPHFGPGPLYVGSISLTSLLAMKIRTWPIFTSGQVQGHSLTFKALGLFFLALGVFLWIQAVILAKLDQHIRENKLLTKGVYSWVRNPVYSAFLFINTGILALGENIWLLILPLLYWGFLTLVLVFTEEKWLRALYGQAYEDYCKKVNRCLPWPAKDRQKT